MTKILKFSETLNEGFAYSYGCLMMHFNIPQWEELLKKFDKEDIYDEEGFGLENEPHITLLFGFYPAVDEKDIKEAVADLTDEYIELKEINIFQNGLYDVVKFDIQSDYLQDINQMLRELFPHKQTHPDYKPHMTLAYIKGGRGVKYIENLEEPIVLKPTKIIYSKPTGSSKDDKIVLKKWKK